MSNLDKALGGDYRDPRADGPGEPVPRAMGRRPSPSPAPWRASVRSAQSIPWLKQPAAVLDRYLSLWIAAAAIAALMVGVEMITRSRRFHSELADDMIRAAIEQFLPVGVAYALLTSVLVVDQLPRASGCCRGLADPVRRRGVLFLRFLPRALGLVGASGIWGGSGLVCIAFGSGR